MPPTKLDFNSGYWGEPTSTINWCETDYEISYYFAEFYNTVSNLAMIVPSLFGIYFTVKNNFEIPYVLCFAFLGFVGVGSWLFHMTLLYQMQLFDELPMLWGGLIGIYCLLLANNQKQVDLWIRLCLLAYGSIVTITYLSSNVPSFFQASCAAMVYFMFYLDYKIAQKLPVDVWLYYASVILYHIAFFLWNIDTIYCRQLEQMRQQYCFLKPFTQLHAVWHLLAGYGSYLHITYTAQARALNCQKRAILVKSWMGVKLLVDSKY